MRACALAKIMHYNDRSKVQIVRSMNILRTYLRIEFVEDNKSGFIVFSDDLVALHVEVIQCGVILHCNKKSEQG